MAGPSWAERDWNRTQDDRAGVLDALEALTHAQHRQVGATVLTQTRPARLAPTLHAARDAAWRLARQTSTARWTRAALTRALTRVLTDPISPQPPASRSYPFPPRAARWIKARDVTCVFPACGKLARSCHNDHLVAWPAGPTHVDNAASECVHHHQAKHASIPASRLPDGTIRWTNRHGTQLDRRPRPLLRGW